MSDVLPTAGIVYQYELNVTACDSASTGWVSSRPFVYGLVQESSVAWSFGPRHAWKIALCQQCSDAYVRTTTIKGAIATLMLPAANNVGLVMETGPTQGAATVTVDGKPRKVNTYAAVTGYRLVEFKMGWSAGGSHTVTITNLATPGHGRIDIDAAVVITSE